MNKILPIMAVIMAIVNLFVVHYINDIKVVAGSLFVLFIIVVLNLIFVFVGDRR